MEAERWEGILEVCRRYGFDPRKAEPERQHCVQLFDQLLKVHELPPEYKLWLEAAAMMQDVGKFMNHQGHHRHTQYIISSSEIYGYTMQQRTIVSAIARYLGKSWPDAMDRVMRAVPAEEHSDVERAIDVSALSHGASDVWVQTLADRDRAGEPDASNSFADPDRMSIASSKLHVDGPKFHYRFSAMSLTVLHFAAE